MNVTVTRFAPSPTGRLHLGHAYSAIYAAEKARNESGRFLLRIEDIDTERCRSEYEEGIFEDLAWLGLEWEEPVRRQSDYSEDYCAALKELQGRGLVYPCFCTRKDILREIQNSGQAPHQMPDQIYPGTCRLLTLTQRERCLSNKTPYSLRIDAAAAADLAGPLCFRDKEHGCILVDPKLQGDAVISRKDIGTSYHLAVVVDDALQGITCVTRGEDLLSATHLQRLLQAVLGLPSPQYEHHVLLVDDSGKRLAKRNYSSTIKGLRDAGHSPEDVRRMTGIGTL